MLVVAIMMSEDLGMKKEIVLTIAIVMAGCSDVGVESAPDETNPSGSLTQPQCTRNSECTDYKKFCTADKQCVQCVADQQCDGNCIESECKEEIEPIENKCTEDCASEGKVCDLNTKTCVACLENADCGDGKLCYNHECVNQNECNDNDSSSDGSNETCIDLYKDADSKRSICKDNHCVQCIEDQCDSDNTTLHICKSGVIFDTPCPFGCNNGLNVYLRNAILIEISTMKMKHV